MILQYPRYLGIICALVILTLDQWSKAAVYGYLLSVPQGQLPVTSFFNLVIVRNYGISFGMLGGLPYGWIILSLIALSILMLLCNWLWKTPKASVAVALGLVIGGAIGNIIDRLQVGAVFDFLDFYIGVYHWPAFNAADSAICVGVTILFWDSIFNDRAHDKNKTQ